MVQPSHYAEQAFRLTPACYESTTLYFAKPATHIIIGHNDCQVLARKSEPCWR